MNFRIAALLSIQLSVYFVETKGYYQVYDVYQEPNYYYPSYGYRRPRVEIELYGQNHDHPRDLPAIRGYLQDKLRGIKSQMEERFRRGRAPPPFPLPLSPPTDSEEDDAAVKRFLQYSMLSVFPMHLNA